MTEPKKRRFLRLRRTILITASVFLALAIVFGVRRALRPTLQISDAMRAQAARVTITRDQWGVPHIDGQSDADAAFGLAYAQCEDNFPLVLDIIAATRGDLALVHLSKTALINDFYVRLVRVNQEADREYERQLSPETRRLLDGFAAGVNYYAALHHDEVDTRHFPVRGRDIAAGFAHKIPLFMGLNRALEAINTRADLKVGDKVEWRLENQAEAGAPDSAGLSAYNMVASNAHAVGRRRSADGIVRLNINSHQPWTGPVAWYEAHVRSDEGWNMIGGTFPGGPVIFHGHNESLGWAHTVNFPDLWDIYRLDTDPARPGEYRVDGQWRKFDVARQTIRIDIGLASIPYARDYLYSDFGPVLQTDAGYFAVRYAGIGRLMRGIEQWYRMNRARNFAEWRAAMELQGLPMFNTVYADSQNIFYVYNALLPERKAGLDYTTVLSGDSADVLWDSYVPFDQLPQTLNPPADFVQNCNSTPWRTTLDPGNPDPRRYPPEAGIETRMTNRALRSLRLFGEAARISRNDFIRFKWDRRFEADAPIMKEAIEPLLASYQPRDEDERRALEVLRGWDRGTEENNRAAALAIFTWRETWRAIEVDRKGPQALPDPVAAFQRATLFLSRHFGRVDPMLGEVQKLRRGRLELPLGGGPDVLNAIHGIEEDGRLVAMAGDSYINIVEFAPQGTQSWSLMQYGASERVASPHYADQAPLFARRQLRDSLFRLEDLAARTERSYRPGEELAP